MTVYSETLVESGEWEIVKLHNDRDDSEHYVLKNGASEGKLSIPFTHVMAGGGIIDLIRCDEIDANDPRRNGVVSGTLSEVLTGLNELRDDTEMPEEVYQELRDIGPW